MKCAQSEKWCNRLVYTPCYYPFKIVGYTPEFKKKKLLGTYKLNTLALNINNDGLGSGYDLIPRERRLS